LSVRFEEHEGGDLKIFLNPEPGMVYTMGVDAATGLANDNSAVCVLSNALPFTQVASYRARVPVNQFTAIVDKMGRYYNEALNVCEINYPGNSVQDALLQYYKYPRNYKPETHLKADYGITEQFGLRTTEITKWLLINETQLALSNGDLILNDINTLSEFINFVYQSSKRKAAAAEGFNDDLVIAAMLAYHGAKLYPFARILKLDTKPKKIILPDYDRAWKDFKAKFANGPEKGVIA